MLKAIIIKGNPLYINTPIAVNYYSSIKNFLISRGVTNVKFDPGEDYTMPDLSSDMFIAHSRGCGRYTYMPEEKKPFFLRFGVSDGVVHPVDLRWIKQTYIKGTVQQPPPEHFLFFDKQKEAILDLIKRVKESKQ